MWPDRLTVLALAGATALALPVSASADTISGTSLPELRVGDPVPTTMTMKGGDDTAFGDPPARLGRGVIRPIPCESDGRNASFTPDGTRILMICGVFDDESSEYYTLNPAVHDLRTAITSLLVPEGDGNSFELVASPDGRRVAFTSYASNFGPYDDNGLLDVYVLTLATGDIVLASATENGEPGDGSSARPQVSPDGRTVMFNTDAPNLGADGGDPAGSATVLKSLQSGAVRTLVSPSADAWFSPDGTEVMFVSDRSDLTPFDRNGKADLYFHKLATGQVFRLAAPPEPDEPDSPGILTAAFSPDARKIAYATPYEIWIKDQVSGKKSRVRAFGGASELVWSPDGTRLAFVDADVVGDAQAYILDLRTLAVVKISWTPGSSPLRDFNESARNIAFSPDGTRVLMDATLDDDPSVAYLVRLPQAAGAGDTILGGGGNDALFGAAGPDRLAGGPGNDLIHGGPGLDTAVFPGRRSRYVVTRLGARTFVRDKTRAEGVDTLVEVERAAFADATLVVRP
jgi:Tol biopolymer transport system component